MAISFQQIPQNLRVPLFYAELNNSQANSGQSLQPTLLIGQMTSSGVAAAGHAVQCAGPANADSLCGPGSVLALMARAYLAIDPEADLWLLPLADPSGGTAATGTYVFAGTTSAAGAVNLYIGGVKVAIPVASGTAAAAVATAVSAAINATPNMPVVATVASATVTLTARNTGLVGNSIDLSVNLGGPAAGEASPAGLTVTPTTLASGAGSPLTSAGLANLSDQPFDFIGHQFSDSTQVGVISTFLADIGGRWAYNAQIYGHAFGAIEATFSAAGTFGAGMNDQHQSFMPFSGHSSPSFIWAAAITAQAATSLRADPALPLQYLALPGIWPPGLSDRFDTVAGEQNTLLYEGMSIYSVSPAGTVEILSLITTYQQNAAGQPDNSYLYVTTMFSLMAILRGLRALVLSKYSRVKLVADNIRPPPGSNVVTPSVIAADLVQWYQSNVPGLVQDASAFAASLIVEQNAQNPNRVDVFAQPILTGGLNVFALLNEFLLAPPASAAA